MIPGIGSLTAYGKLDNRYSMSLKRGIDYTVALSKAKDR